jgi:hypothetical protein
MIPSFEQRHSPGGIAKPCFGVSSSAASSSTTNNTDARVVGGEGSTNISAANSQITVTDGGAVAAGIGLAAKALDVNANSGAAMFEGALKTVDQAGERLALAYQSGQAGDQTSLKYAGFAVVGLAAVMLFSRVNK